MDKAAAATLTGADAPANRSTRKRLGGNGDRRRDGGVNAAWKTPWVAEEGATSVAGPLCMGPESRGKQEGKRDHSARGRSGDGGQGWGARELALWVLAPTQSTAHADLDPIDLLEPGLIEGLRGRKLVSLRLRGRTGRVGRQRQLGSTAPTSPASAFGGRRRKRVRGI